MLGMLLWPVSALLWWNAEHPAVEVAVAVALLLLELCLHLGALRRGLRVGLSCVAVAVYAGLAIWVAPNPSVVLFACTAAAVACVGVTGALEAPRPTRAAVQETPRANLAERANGIGIAALVAYFGLSVLGHDDAILRISLVALVLLGALELLRSSFGAGHVAVDAATARAVGPGPRVALAGAAALAPLPLLPALHPITASLPGMAMLATGAFTIGARLRGRSRSTPARAGLTERLRGSTHAAGSAMDGTASDDPAAADKEGEAPDADARANLPRADLWGWMSERPSRALAVTFGLAGLSGGALLALPFCTAASASSGPAGGAALLDALFTSFSAVCVTGLIVLDTPHDFTFLGQLVILLLIQLGGLGIMTFSTAALTFLGGRMSLRQEATAAHLANVEDRRRIGESVRTILWGTLIAETAGAVLLYLAFLSAGDRHLEAAWRAVFTAVSAFCNAGFALQSNSLVDYQVHTPVLLICAALIVAGGLGPLLVAAVATSNLSPFDRRAPRKGLSVQYKLALSTTLVLLVVSTVMWSAFEWNQSFAHLRVDQRLANALFQAVTLRTAGFNSVDFASLHPATLLVSMAFMFVGGCPGSTAGGIKTTTIAVLALRLRSTFRRDEATIYDATAVHAESVQNATAVLLLGIGAVMLLTVTLLLTQGLPFLSALFEAVSALATVGLSMGATAELDGVGKTAIIIGMFVGRIGPLTLLLGLAAPGQRGVPAGRYPEKAIDVG